MFGLESGRRVRSYGGTICQRRPYNRVDYGVWFTTLSRTWSSLFFVGAERYLILYITWFDWIGFTYWNKLEFVISAHTIWYNLFSDNLNLKYADKTRETRCTRFKSCTRWICIPPPPLEGKIGTSPWKKFGGQF